MQPDFSSPDRNISHFIVLAQKHDLLVVVRVSSFNYNQNSFQSLRATTNIIKIPTFNSFRPFSCMVRTELCYLPKFVCPLHFFRRDHTCVVNGNLGAFQRGYTRTGLFPSARTQSHTYRPLSTIGKPNCFRRCALIMTRQEISAKRNDGGRY